MTAITATEGWHARYPLGECYDCQNGRCRQPAADRCHEDRPCAATTLKDGAGLCRACARGNDLQRVSRQRQTPRPALARAG